MNYCFKKIFFFSVIVFMGSCVHKNVQSERPVIEEKENLCYSNSAGRYIEFGDTSMEAYATSKAFMRHPYIKVDMLNPDIPFIYSQFDSAIAFAEMIGFDEAYFMPVIVGYDEDKLYRAHFNEERRYDEMIQQYIDTAKWLPKADAFLRDNYFYGMLPNLYYSGEEGEMTCSRYKTFVDSLKREQVFFIQFMAMRIPYSCVGNGYKTICKERYFTYKKNRKDTIDHWKK